MFGGTTEDKRKENISSLGGHKNISFIKYDRVRLISSASGILHLTPIRSSIYRNRGKVVLSFKDKSCWVHSK